MQLQSRTTKKERSKAQQNQEERNKERERERKRKNMPTISDCSLQIISTSASKKEIGRKREKTDK